MKNIFFTRHGLALLSVVVPLSVLAGCGGGNNSLNPTTGTPVPQNTPGSTPVPTASSTPRSTPAPTASSTPMPTATATAVPSDGRSAVVTPNLTFSGVSSDVKISTQPIVTFNDQLLGVVDTTTNSSRNEGIVLLQGAVSSRNLRVNLQLRGPLNANKRIAVGQTFSLSRTGSSLSFEGTDTNASRGDYYSASGTATITALSDDAKTITVSLSNVRMLPDDTFGFAGSGNFTINGTLRGSNLGNRIGAV